MNVSTLYHPTIAAMASIGALLLLQLIVADLTGIKAKHKPGHPIPPDSRSFLFRAARAHANTNESIAIFMLFAMTGMLAGANPAWLNNLSWAYVLCRAVHMAVYYLGWFLPRAIVFGLSLFVFAGMLGLVLHTL